MSTLDLRLSLSHEVENDYTSFTGLWEHLYKIMDIKARARQFGTAPATGVGKEKLKIPTDGNPSQGSRLMAGTLM